MLITLNGKIKKKGEKTMLVKRGEANKMYCPFKFSKPASASKELWQINPEWICEGSGCMAWQKIVGSRWVGEHGYCGLAGKPLDISTEPRSIHNGPFKKRA
jgi:hypothetical protein